MLGSKIQLLILLFVEVVHLHDVNECFVLFCILFIKVAFVDMDTELTMTPTESPMETASPRDVDISSEVLEVNECLILPSCR